MYETFWRKYDDMLHNSMLEVSAELLLFRTPIKFLFRNIKKVIANGEELLPNVIKYSPNAMVVRVYFPYYPFAYAGG